MDSLFSNESNLDHMRERSRRQQLTKGLNQDEIEVFTCVQRLVITIDHMEQFQKRVEMTSRFLKDGDYKALEKLFPKGKKDKKAETKRISKRKSTASYECNSPPSSTTSSSSGSSSPTPESVTLSTALTNKVGPTRNGRRSSKVK